MSCKIHAKGLVPTTFTPFDDDGKLNVDVIPAYAKYLSENNVNGAMVGGTASEGPGLSLCERKDLVDAWVKAAEPLGLNVVIHVGGLPMAEVLELARYCESAGPDAIITLPEMYYKPPDVDTLVRYVKLVSENAPSLPILFYDHPAMSGVTFSMSMFFDKATKAIPNFKGVKCGFIAGLEISSANELNADQLIFMANHVPIASAFMMGYTSTMSAIANVFPAMLLDIDKAIQQGDVKKAKGLQLELNKRVNVITEQGQYVPFVKAAMQHVSGVQVGNTRDPLPQVTPEQRKHLEEKLRKMLG